VGLASSLPEANETESLLKERFEKGVRRKTYVRNRKENWRCNMLYRGVKVNPSNVDNTPVAREGVYRGVKWSSKDVDNTFSAKSGVYRGIKWNSNNNSK